MNNLWLNHAAFSSVLLRIDTTGSAKVIARVPLVVDVDFEVPGFVADDEFVTLCISRCQSEINDDATVGLDRSVAVVSTNGKGVQHLIGSANQTDGVFPLRGKNSVGYGQIRTTSSGLVFTKVVNDEENESITVSLPGNPEYRSYQIQHQVLLTVCQDSSTLIRCVDMNSTKLSSVEIEGLKYLMSVVVDQNGSLIALFGNRPLRASKLWVYKLDTLAEKIHAKLLDSKVVENEVEVFSKLGLTFSDGEPALFFQLSNTGSF